MRTIIEGCQDCRTWRWRRFGEIADDAIFARKWNALREIARHCSLTMPPTAASNSFITRRSRPRLRRPAIPGLGLLPAGSALRRREYEDRLAIAKSLRLEPGTATRFPPPNLYDGGDESPAAKSIVRSRMQIPKRRVR